MPIKAERKHPNILQREGPLVLTSNRQHPPKGGNLYHHKYDTPFSDASRSLQLFGMVSGADPVPHLVPRILAPQMVLWSAPLAPAA